jgi:hypothetical protein
LDQLIVDEKPNSNYVLRDNERSPEMKQFFQAFLEKRGDEIPDSPMKRKAKAAFDRGEELDKNGEFKRIQDQDSLTGEMKDVYVELDAKARGLLFCCSTLPVLYRMH